MTNQIPVFVFATSKHDRTYWIVIKIAKSIFSLVCINGRDGKWVDGQIIRKSVTFNQTTHTGVDPRIHSLFKIMHISEDTQSIYLSDKDFYYWEYTNFEDLCANHIVEML